MLCFSLYIVNQAFGLDEMALRSLLWTQGVFTVPRVSQGIKKISIYLAPSTHV